MIKAACLYSRQAASIIQIGVSWINLWYQAIRRPILTCSSAYLEMGVLRYSYILLEDSLPLAHIEDSGRDVLHGRKSFL